MRAGIRHGCRLSPLIFVVVVDTLLRHILAEIPSAKVRGYADDIALVTGDLLRDAPALQAIFDKFAAVSGLRFNFAKTLTVPLGYTAPGQLRSQFQRTNHPWAVAQCASHAAYLGISTGFGRGENSWQKPLGNEAHSRATIWRWSSIGLQFAAKAYNLFVLPSGACILQRSEPAAGICHSTYILSMVM